MAKLDPAGFALIAVRRVREVYGRAVCGHSINSVAPFWGVTLEDSESDSMGVC
jgi:hypothetical protein